MHRHILQSLQGLMNIGLYGGYTTQRVDTTMQPIYQAEWNLTAIPSPEPFYPIIPDNQIHAWLPPTINNAIESKANAENSIF